MQSNVFPSHYREQLADAIPEFIDTELQQFKQLPWVTETIRTLSEFCVAGKLARGTTFVHLAHILGVDVPKEKQLQPETILSIGVGIELFGSALLIHDDIMDQDSKRRGKPTIHAQFATWAKKHNRNQHQHDGISAGITIGDILLFMVNSACFHRLDPAMSTQTIQKLLLQFSRQALFTGFGQLTDSIGLPSQLPLSTQDVLTLFRAKTGHYTLGMPLTIAAIVSQQSDEHIARWDRIGELVGTLFQIKDDELGLFGDPAVTGKSNASDIKQNKRTLFFLATQQALTKANRTEDLNFLETAYGNAHLSELERTQVVELIETSGARQSVIKTMQDLAAAATEELNLLQPSPTLQAWFAELLEFHLTRTK